MLHELELKIGWGKAVQLPPLPLYTQSNVGVGLGTMGKSAGAAVPPPGTEMAPPWVDQHSNDLQGVGELPLCPSIARICMQRHGQ